MTTAPAPIIAATRRDPRLDAVRGTVLVVMLLSHLPLTQHAVFRPIFGLATAGQVFIFLSGIVSGMVLLRTRMRDGPGSLWSGARQRFRRIYAAHLLIVAAIVLLSVVHFDPNDPRMADGCLGRIPIGGIFAGRPLLSMALGAAFLVQPSFAGILPLYCVFSLAAPLIVEARLRGGWRSVLVLAISAVLWISTQFGLEQALLTWLGGHVAVYVSGFRLTAWQLLFVGGLYLGTPGSGATRALGLRIIDWTSERRGLLVAGGTIWSIMLFLRFAAPATLDVDAIWAVLDPSVFGPAALVGFALLALLGGVAVRSMSPTLVASLGVRALALLGRHSLVVFVFHVPIVMAVSIALPISPTWHLPVALTAAAALWLPALVGEARRGRRTATSVSSAAFVGAVAAQRARPLPLPSPDLGVSRLAGPQTSAAEARVAAVSPSRRSPSDG